jgi:hypothetical protein
MVPSGTLCHIVSGSKDQTQLKAGATVDGKPGEPGQGENPTAKVTLYKDTVSFRARIEYRGGAPEDIPFDTDNLQGAKAHATHHMTQAGFSAVSAWRVSTGDGTVTRLFRLRPADQS